MLRLRTAWWQGIRMQLLLLQLLLHVVLHQMLQMLLLLLREAQASTFCRRVLQQRHEHFLRERRRSTHHFQVLRCEGDNWLRIAPPRGPGI